jgi:hypothetical protein
MSGRPIANGLLPENRLTCGKHREISHGEVPVQIVLVLPSDHMDTRVRADEPGEHVAHRSRVPRPPAHDDNVNGKLRQLCGGGHEEFGPLRRRELPPVTITMSSSLMPSDDPQCLACSAPPRGSGGLKVRAERKKLHLAERHVVYLVEERGAGRHDRENPAQVRARSIKKPLPADAMEDLP